ncbi:MAG: hypothetical protein Fur0039_13920 [Rhodocyclaceae bacterium]
MPPPARRCAGPAIRAAAALAVAACMAGCATPVALSLLGGGTSAVVSHGLNGSVSRSFTAPPARVRTACVRALETMGVKMQAEGESGDALLARAGDRSIRVEFERLGESLTLMKVTASRPDFLRDAATAREVVAQTERALAAPTAKPAVQTRAAAPAPTYIVVLDTAPAGKLRPARRLSSRLKEYVVYRVESERDGRRVSDLNLGYFATEARAEAARRLVRSSYPRARVQRLDAPPPALTAARADAGPAL